MRSPYFYTAGKSPALEYAAKVLEDLGCSVSSQPNDSVSHLLLPAPAFEAPGILKGGVALAPILSQLPIDLTVIGGHLQDSSLSGYRSRDLLQDPLYLAENARITAYCAVQIATAQMDMILWDCPVLVIGWGRIGKCLCALLKQMGALVTVGVRKEADRAMVLALGYDAILLETPAYGLIRYRVIFNTAPAPVLTEEALAYCRPDCLRIDLASQKGIAGDDTIWARGLPGKYAPESSGLLIAKSALRLR